MNKKNFQSSAGFSLVELTVVLILSLIMAAISVYYLYSYQKLYRPDEQALYLVDMLQEARQKALTQKETMRVEIDLTDGVARLIAERESGTANDDVKVRSFIFRTTQEVQMEQRPSNVSTSPVEPSPVDPVAFVINSPHPLSLGHKVATIRFKQDGTVTNAGTNATGAGAIVAGTTVFVWQPNKSNINNSDITRAITIIGSTGAIRLWQYNPTQPANTQWKDSRRVQ